MRCVPTPIAKQSLSVTAMFNNMDGGGGSGGGGGGGGGGAGMPAAGGERPGLFVSSVAWSPDGRASHCILYSWHFLAVFPTLIFSSRLSLPGVLLSNYRSAL
jgi:hypothetical protein